jgi:hypothetical protein
MASYESMPLEGRAAIVKDLSLSLIAFTCGIWQRLQRNLKKWNLGSASGVT